MKLKDIVDQYKHRRARTDRELERERCVRVGPVVIHRVGCRPGRPLCRWMRVVEEKYSVCTCPAYHFPHRRNSGLCGHPERLTAMLWGVKLRTSRS